MRARSLFATPLLAAVALGALVAAGPARADTAPPKVHDIVVTYANIAEAIYGDSLATAKDLQKAVEAFLAEPTQANLDKARVAWKAARVPYQQSEGFRFGNKIVDEWEGNVNAWPLDEGLIDYVDKKSYGETSDENPLYTANVIANTKIRVGKKTIDASKITPKLLRSLQEAGGVESNVAIGYHAIEFLLWGQDLNGTGPGAGNRPASDYDLKNCSNGHCDRRAAYLKAATELLVADLEEMSKAWAAKGKARAVVLKQKDNAALGTILTGLGSLSYGELAGERMKLGLILHDPEEEHDCFSDNTHNSHYYDELGIASIYRGKYTRVDGSVVEGASVDALATAKAPKAAEEANARIDAALAALKAIKDEADSGKEAYDQMIAEGNTAGNALVQKGVDSLVAQTRAIEGVVAGLKLKIKVEGSDSLDDPSKVSE
ncbi:imelysin family protein [Ancylobacter amanitiformis]|uniref:Iron-regulated protein n=1 Tax=Ancylobacter amanitiformis TaxID=217069 RepID=A0ABU0LWJ0_9HYPH|nr:imelysin family protein [Ancylobacter amanitiformis]MDQ0513032.1 putative iron-regulated protein [Ancylobacter amanitiformis]